MSLEHDPGTARSNGHLVQEDPALVDAQEGELELRFEDARGGQHCEEGHHHYRPIHDVENYMSGVRDLKIRREGWRREEKGERVVSVNTGKSELLGGLFGSGSHFAWGLNCFVNSFGDLDNTLSFFALSGLNSFTFTSSLIFSLGSTFQVRFSNSALGILSLFHLLLILHRRLLNVVLLLLVLLSLGYVVKLHLIAVGSEVDMQCEVVVLVVLAEHLEAVLDNEVVGIILGDAELEHVSVFLAGHPCLVDHHGHSNGVLAMLLLLLGPLLRGDALDVDIMGSGFALAPHKHLHIELGHSLFEVELLEVQPAVVLLQL